MSIHINMKELIQLDAIVGDFFRNSEIFLEKIKSYGTKEVIFSTNSQDNNQLSKEKIYGTTEQQPSATRQ